MTRAESNEIADYQQHVGIALVGDVDNAAEGAAHFIAQLHSALVRPEGVGFEMNVGSMNDT